MAYDNTNKGAAWKKRDKDGKGFLSGSINVEGTECWISIFANTYKKSDKQPDYNITVKPKEEKRTEERTEAGGFEEYEF